MQPTHDTEHCLAGQALQQQYSTANHSGVRQINKPVTQSWKRASLHWNLSTVGECWAHGELYILSRVRDLKLVERWLIRYEISPNVAKYKGNFWMPVRILNDVFTLLSSYKCTII